MKMVVRLAVTAFVVVASLALVGFAGAGKGGPSPGVELGGRGVASVHGTVRYVATSRAGRTTVTAIDRDGQVVGRVAVRGVLGVPRVAFDGTLGGLAYDGRTLVLASAKVGAPTSTFTVLATRPLELRRTISLHGTWSYDALSPDGRRLYLVEHSASGPTYRVRAYDVIGGKLLREAVVDPRLGGRSMAGVPVTQTHGPRGVWAYTLYQKPGGLSFVHALDTVRGKALCVDLPWRGNQGRLFDVRMSVQGRKLLLRGVSGTPLATIDTREFFVRAHHNPLRAGRA